MEHEKYIRVRTCCLRSEAYILPMFCSDPAPFLFVSFEMKKEDSLKPYDPKKSVWVPDGEGGYDEALITEVRAYFLVELYLVGKFNIFKWHV